MITPNPGEKQFLTLAAKALSGKATADESSLLAKYVQENETYGATLDHMRTIHEAEKNDEFLESAIRVLCGTEAPEKMRALEKDDPQLWKKFQYMRSVMLGIARATRVEDDIESEPMPERVRSALLAKLKDTKTGS